MDTFIRSMNTRLDANLREHLKNVYGSLALSTLVAAAGAYLHLYTELLAGSILLPLASFGSLMALLFTPDQNGKNRLTRLMFLLTFSFFTGLGLGPLLDIVIMVDPSIIPTAFMATSFVFVSFSASALLANDGQYLAYGGTLLSLLATTTLLGLANIFFASQLLFQVHLYLGLFVMCGFVLYDTQLIIEKRRRGDKDYVAHALDLFIDFVSIFRRLLVILSQKEDSKKRRN